MAEGEGTACSVREGPSAERSPPALLAGRGGGRGRLSCATQERGCRIKPVGLGAALGQEQGRQGLGEVDAQESPCPSG